MTKRRDILKVGATGVVAALAGCVDSENDTTNNTTDNSTTNETMNSTTDDTDSDDTPTDNTTDDTETDNTTDNTTDDSQNDDTVQSTVDTTVTLNNEGSSAWVVTSVDGATQEDIVTNESNATVELIEGNRYRFVNNGGSFHPLAFRDSQGTVLLSESGSGEFESDSDVNWVDGDGSVEFTVTSELASRLNEYYCTVHSPMVGSVTVSSGS